MILTGLLLSSVFTKAETGFWSSVGQNELLLMFTCGILIFVILVMISLLLSISSFLDHANVKLGQISALSGFIRSLTDAVPVQEEAAVLTDHEYDGIRELDNNLPPWWKYLFYASIVFAGVYIYTYHLSDWGSLQHEEYEQEMIAAQQELATNVKLASVSIDENNIHLSDAKGIENGMTMFESYCAACHGKAGEGGVGPNLTDEYWLHGGSMADVFKTIKYGVPEKGMISWKSQLGGADIQDITSYIATLKGTNPPNAKAPQGEKSAATEGAVAEAEIVEVGK